MNAPGCGQIIDGVWLSRNGTELANARPNLGLGFSAASKSLPGTELTKIIYEPFMPITGIPIPMSSKLVRSASPELIYHITSSAVAVITPE